MTSFSTENASGVFPASPPRQVLAIPLSNDGTSVKHAWLDIPRPLTQQEYVQFLATLEAMRPALVVPEPADIPPFYERYVPKAKEEDSKTSSEQPHLQPPVNSYWRHKHLPNYLFYLVIITGPTSDGGVAWESVVGDASGQTSLARFYQNYSPQSLLHPGETGHIQ